MVFDSGVLLGASGVLAVVAGFWSKAKEIGTRLLSHVIVMNGCEREVGSLVVTHLNATCRRSPFESRAFVSMMHFVRPLGRRRRVLFQSLAITSGLYWRGWRPIWVSVGAPKEGPTPSSSHSMAFTFSYVRGTFDWTQILNDAEEAEDQQLSRVAGAGRYRVVHIVGHGLQQMAGLLKNENSAPPQGSSEQFDPIRARFDGHVPVRWKWDELGPRQSASAIGALSLSPALMSLVEEIRFWHRSREWYAERGVAWRRGCLFHGGPGTGKTSLARAVAEELDLPVFVFDLASLTNTEFVEGWNRAMSNMPCMVLIEDFDAVFRGRQNMVPNGSLTFDIVLNCLDGIERPDGLLLIVTTNNLQHVDPALGCSAGADGASTRPGRIDRVVEFVPLDDDGRLKMALRIVKDAALARELSRAGSADSAAQFQERCFRAALARLFDATAPDRKAA